MEWGGAWRGREGETDRETHRVYVEEKGHFKK